MQGVGESVLPMAVVRRDAVAWVWDAVRPGEEMCVKMNRQGLDADLPSEANLRRKAGDRRKTMIGLPDGYTARPATIEDGNAIVSFLNAYYRQLIGRDVSSAEQLASQLRMPGIDLAEDTRLVFDAEGNVAALADALHFAPHVTVQAQGTVGHEHQGKGIGTAVLDWIEKRALRALDLAPAEARVILMQSLDDRETSASAFLRQRGFTECRHFFRMLIDMAERPPEPQWPDGTSVRSIEPEVDLEAAYRASRDAFKDHWGHVDTPFEEGIQRIRHRIENDPDFDASLRFVAQDGDEIAAICNASPKDGGDATTGYIETLGVRRPWRRRGLALALLLHTFGTFYDRGTRKVALHVDTESLTGATRLYEKAGMTVDELNHAFEKELRAGVDLSTQRVDP